MIATVIVLCIVVVAFWRSAVRLLIAALLVLLVIGGIEAVQVIDAIVTLDPRHQLQ
jgi:hypothetical protein